MKILVIGSGGREHALVWKIRQSPLVSKIYCAPGNAGIGEIAELVPIKATEIDKLLQFVIEHSIDLTVVGSEQPLVQGIVNTFEANGRYIYGPSREAAMLEGSKMFAKQFMQKYNIPTAEFRAFSANQRFDAERFINETPPPLVVKADGLAGGKGVLVCQSKEEALDAVRKMFDDKIFGDAGQNLVIEEFLVGEEASVFILTDGKNYATLPAAQDHKRIFDHDEGKNTGGMGAYAPAPVIGDELLERIKRNIVRPTLLGMENEGMPYRGCLYFGLMITETGPKVIEYNCRFGDPEAQVVLPLLDCDLVQIMFDSIRGNISQQRVTMKKQSAVCVVIVSGGYPDRYEVGKPVLGLESAGEQPDVVLFHAGTSSEKGKTVTAGGRVLGVTAIGDDLEHTIDSAYRAVNKITFDNMYYRSDIGKKGVLRMKQIS
ncbi:MAG TPA: phosphoribosylamine--glycine ligase [Bacteroidota bacterium]|jgi:phosphoribosylamine--glycine ligase|nr:phosphoribosylamine--glycine ligase [Bacteroidota bacterium]